MLKRLNFMSNNKGEKKNKCAICKEMFDDGETYEYRGFLACAEHFDELQRKVDHKRKEVMEVVEHSIRSQADGEWQNGGYKTMKVGTDGKPITKVKELGMKLHEARRMLKIAEREEYEKTTKVSVYGSDDYVGASAGDTTFYFGYEVTKCPIKSHKDQDDCDDSDCEKREWVFQVERNGKVVFEMLESELSYPESDDIERKLIVGMAHYIKTLAPIKEE